MKERSKIKMREGERKNREERINEGENIDKDTNEREYIYREKERK